MFFGEPKEIEMQTKMTNPPNGQTTLQQDPNQATEAKQPAVEPAKAPEPKAPAKVKVKLMRSAIAGGAQREAGEEVMVTEKEAKQLCKAYQGPWTHYGLKDEYDEKTRHRIVRAVRVA